MTLSLPADAGNWFPSDPTSVAQILKIKVTYTPPPPHNFKQMSSFGENCEHYIERVGVPRSVLFCVALLTRAFLGNSLMKHPLRSDFDTLVTDEGVTVTFTQTNSRYSFHRLTNPNNIARVGPISFAGVQHTGRGTGDYSSDEVQNMAQHIAAEFARSFRSPLDEALSAARGERVDNVTPLRLVSLTSVPWRISSEITATLGLIQGQDEPD